MKKSLMMSPDMMSLDTSGTEDTLMNSMSSSVSCEISLNGFKIMNQDVRIDREGLQNIRTGER
jgi:hypothetical protein